MRGDKIIQQVMREHLLGPSDFFGSCRQPHLVAARKAAALRLTEMGLSSSQVGKLLRRNHTTVINLINPQFRARKQQRYANARAVRLLNPEARARILKTASLEETTPDVIIAQLINKWVRLDRSEVAA
jgi:hypothetical protein